MNNLNIKNLIVFISAVLFGISSAADFGGDMGGGMGGGGMDGGGMGGGNNGPMNNLDAAPPGGAGGMGGMGGEGGEM